MVNESCVPAAPAGAAEMLIHADGLSEISTPPTVQSSRCFNESGIAPAYSGVENRIAVALAMR